MTGSLLRLAGPIAFLFILLPFLFIKCDIKYNNSKMKKKKIAFQSWILLDRFIQILMEKNEQKKRSFHCSSPAVD